MKDRVARFLLVLLPVVFAYLIGCIVRELGNAR
jgi:hypothetical protein